MVAAVIVAVLLVLPLIAWIFPAVNIEPEVYENRSMWPKPFLSVTGIDTYPMRFEGYFNDRFGYRKLMVQTNNRVKYDVFRVSGSDKVIVGKDGWLFYNAGSINYDYRGITRLSAEELEKFREVFESRKYKLASRGVAYMLVVVPNKNSIYPEYMPDEYTKVSTETPLDSVLSYMKKNSDVDLVDLRGVLLKEKGNGLVYEQTDTHWTELGAYRAYLEIINRISDMVPGTAPLTMDEISRSESDTPGGDLARMLGLQDHFNETLPVLSPANPAAVLTVEDKDNVVAETHDDRLPRAMMFHDSFGEHLKPYLSENFSEIRYRLDPWDSRTTVNDIVRESNPDIVIEEVVERNIMDYLSPTYSVRDGSAT